MRILLLLILPVFTSCAHFNELDREPSSEAEILRYGDHDPMKSSVKEFPPQFEEPIIRHFYFVELKDAEGNFIDRDLHEFQVKQKEKILPVKVQRSLRGRYYVILEAKKSVTTGALDFYVSGLKLRESFKLGLNPAHPAHTKMRQLKAFRTKLKLELVLKDKNGRFVETPDPPEIIVDGAGDIDIKHEHMGNGTWQITLSYPMGNQLFYISVRSHGVYFKNLFRFQYVDKQAR